jgi:hypothetical protein
MEAAVSGDGGGGKQRWRRWKAEMEAAVSRDGGGGKRRRRWKYAEMENTNRYYFISMTSTIYSTLVLIVKGTRHVHTKYSNWTSKKWSNGRYWSVA